MMRMSELVHRLPGYVQVLEDKSKIDSNDGLPRAYRFAQLFTILRHLAARSWAGSCTLPLNKNSRIGLISVWKWRTSRLYTYIKRLTG